MTIEQLLTLATLFLVASLHSAVGLAGGTTYNTFFALLGYSQATATSTALALNTMVSSIASLQFSWFKHLSVKKLLPLLIGSMPMAHLGALITVPKWLWYGLLLIALLTMMIELARRVFKIKQQAIQYAPENAVAPPNQPPTKTSRPNIAILVLVTIGAILGFISGAVGIGGGIFLIPILLMLHLATQQQASALGIVFILINSIIGLITKWQHTSFDVHTLLSSLIVVAFGSLIGSYVGAKPASQVHLYRLQQVLLGVLALAWLGLLYKLIGLWQ